MTVTLLVTSKTSRGLVLVLVQFTVSLLVLFFYETCFHPSTRLFFPQLHFLSPSLGIDGLSVAVRTGAELKNSTLQLLFPRVVFVCSDIVPALLSPPNFIRAVSADKECVNWD